MNWIKTPLPADSRLVKAQLAKNLSCGGKVTQSLCQRLLSQMHGENAPDTCSLFENGLENWIIGSSELIASRVVDLERRTELWSGDLCDPAIALAGLVDEIVDYLKEEQGVAVLFENGCARKGDPGVDSYESPYAYVDHQLVHLITPGSTYEEVRKSILEAFSGSWLVGIFVKSFHGSDDMLMDIMQTRELGNRPGGVHTLVQNAERIVATALDFEAYLIADLK